MPLAAGDKLGPYEILAPLGAGGMGEVYKARDTRLDRSVAIKVLPEHIAKREDLRVRFEREARAVASLNHPNICVLHDIGSHEGAGYMVMEYMEGETLAARIGKGALPLDQALQFATQIADALDRAHRAGVTHRDVKPQNIMLTRDGVKVLDFGLAKSSGSTAGPTDQTLTAVLTAEGAVLGTPQYMAPEQFAGKEADARSDIWAFGAVLYEMVTGQKAFQGKNYTSLVGAILSADPPPLSIKPVTPSWLDRLIRRCLAKEPDQRYQSIRDIVLDLQILPLETTPTPAVTAQWPRMAAAAAGLLAIGALVGRLWIGGSAASPPLAFNFEMNPPPGSQFAPIVDYGGSAISPDGRTLAFVAVNGEGVTLIHVRALESREARTLPGTENGARPFWSPDSKSLGFVAGAKLKRIDIVGGLPIALCENRFARGGTWNQDGVILFGEQSSPLKRISASGGTPTAAIPLNGAAGERAHYYPQFLPDGKRFLYLANHSEGLENSGIMIGSLDGQPPIRILLTPYKAVYDPNSGRLLFMSTPGTLMTQKLELDPPRLTGEPTKVTEGVGVTTNNRFVDFSVSRNGTLFFGQRNGAGQMLQFGWRDRTGKLLAAVGQPVDARLWFDLSPDNGQLVHYAGTASGIADLWVMDLANGLRTRVTFSTGFSPRWAPGGKDIYYMSIKGLRRKTVDGSGEEELLLPAPNRSLFLMDVSPDRKYLLIGDRDLMLLPLTGERKPVPYLQTNAAEREGTFSPDGRWVAYSSDESGRDEIYLQEFPERRGKRLVSAEGGAHPQWRADGKEIYWTRPDGMLMAASVELRLDGVRFGRAETLFVVSDAGGYSNYQPSRDGRRFLVLDPTKGAHQNPPMVVMQNWAAGLGK